jgi:hypothetical protein
MGNQKKTSRWSVRAGGRLAEDRQGVGQGNAVGATAAADDDAQVAPPIGRPTLGDLVEHLLPGCGGGQMLISVVSMGQASCYA